MQLGDKKQASYKITSHIYQGFLGLFSDRNKLHISDEYAKGFGFEEKVMHGNILSGFVSHFIGEVFPAENCILQSQELQFKKPCYQDDEILIEAEIAQVIEAVSTLVLKLTIHNKTRKTIAAKGKVQVGRL